MNLQPLFLAVPAMGKAISLKELGVRARSQNDLLFLTTK